MSHDVVEKNIGLMAILVIITIAVGGIVEIVPLFTMQETTEPVEGLEPYSALELEGRDIYIREGCSNCHSQMIRPFRSETERYGHYSVAGEFVYDHPFLWGSKRTGPDLHRVGGRFPDNWHRAHLINPRDLVPESNMPGYPWLDTRLVDGSTTARKMEVLRTLGVPYTDEQIKTAQTDAEFKADKKTRHTEMDALIAYLQGLGTSIKTNPGAAGG